MGSLVDTCKSKFAAVTGSLVDTCKSKYAAAVFVTAVFVVVICLSILIRITEVDDRVGCVIKYSVCSPFVSDPDANCKENCLKLTDDKYEYYDGQCRLPMSAHPFPEVCVCCRKERSRAEREESI